MSDRSGGSLSPAGEAMAWGDATSSRGLTTPYRGYFEQIRHNPGHRLDFQRKEPGKQQVLKGQVRAQVRAGDSTDEFRQEDAAGRLL
jgi:hypothetical protein